jgi:hypothetical protein
MKRVTMPLACVLSTVAGAALVLAMGMERQPQAPPTLGQPGRYQIVLHPVTVKSTFLLDTASGESWVLTSTKGEDGKDAALSWQPILHAR